MRVRPKCVESYHDGHMFVQLTASIYYNYSPVLPTKRDADLISYLWSASVYPTFSTHNNRFKNSVFTICFLEFLVNLVTVQIGVFSVILLFLSVCDCYVHVSLFNPAYGCHISTNVMLLFSSSFACIITFIVNQHCLHSDTTTAFPALQAELYSKRLNAWTVTHSQTN